MLVQFYKETQFDQLQNIQQSRSYLDTSVNQPNFQSYLEQINPAQPLAIDDQTQFHLSLPADQKEPPALKTAAGEEANPQISRTAEEPGAAQTTDQILQQSNSQDSIQPQKSDQKNKSLKELLQKKDDKKTLPLPDQITGLQAFIEYFQTENTEKKAGREKSLLLKEIKIRFKDLPDRLKSQIKALVQKLNQGSINEAQFQGQFLAILSDKKNLTLDKKDLLKKISLQIVNKNQSITFQSQAKVKSSNQNQNIDLVLPGQVDLAAENDQAVNPSNRPDTFNKTDRQKLKHKKEPLESVPKNESLDVKESRPLLQQFKIEAAEINPASKNEAQPQKVNMARTLAQHKQQLFEQVANNTRVILNNNESQFTTMLRPESLGRIDLKVNLKDGKLLGKIILQNQEAADFFRANVEELRAVFQKSDVEMEKLDIFIAGQATGQNDQKRDSKPFEQDEKQGNILLKKAARVFEENHDPGWEKLSPGGDHLINMFI